MKNPSEQNDSHETWPQHKTNRITPYLEELEGSNENQGTVSSVIHFSCCRLSQRIKQRPKQHVSTHEATYEAQSNSCSLSRVHAFHISGSSSVPDVVASHPIRPLTAKTGSTNILWNGTDNLAYNEDNHSLSENAAVLDSSGSQSQGQPKVGTHYCNGVQHVQQRYSWDCGIASIMMVLTAEQRKYLCDNLEQIYEEEGFYKSTWTIDLAYLLHRFNVPFRYFTITLGVDTGLTSEEFYQEVIHRDAMRVVDRFNSASTHGVFVQKASIPLHELVQHLHKGLPIILLTNARLLRCSQCVFAATRSTLRACFAACNSGKNGGYVGHFVVLMGYSNRDGGIIYYANPSTRDPVCCCTYNEIEEARLSYGTDEDVILVDGLPGGHTQ